MGAPLIIPPTVVEVVESGENHVVTNASANVLQLVVDGANVTVLTSPGTNEVEITD